MSIRFLKFGAVFLLLGILLGVAMHHQHSRSLIPVHAHVTLAGGFLMILFGLVYRAFAALGRSRLAAWHFWLHAIPSVLLLSHASFFALSGRSFDDTQEHGMAIVVALLGMAMLASLVLFAVNVFINGAKEE